MKRWRRGDGRPECLFLIFQGADIKVCTFGLAQPEQQVLKSVNVAQQATQMVWERKHVELQDQFSLSDAARLAPLKSIYKREAGADSGACGGNTLQVGFLHCAAVC